MSTPINAGVPFEDTERKVYDTHDSKTPVQALLQDYNNINRMWDDYHRISAAHRLNRQFASSYSQGSLKLSSKEPLLEVIHPETDLYNNSEINVGNQCTKSFKPYPKGSQETAKSQNSNSQKEQKQIKDCDIRELKSGLNLRSFESSKLIGCTVTVCDIEPTGFKLERIGMYNEYFEICHKKSGYEVGTKESFNERLQKSRKDLNLMLKSRPEWSKFRWINVNGIEDFSLKMVLKDCDVNVSHFKSQLRVSRLANNDKTHQHDLTFVSNEISDEQFIFQLRSLGILPKKSDDEYDISNLAKTRGSHWGKIQSMLYNKSPEVKDLPSTVLPPLNVRLQDYAREYPFRLGHSNSHDKSNLKDELGTFLVLNESNTVISFFEYSGDRIEKEVVLRFIKTLKQHRAIDTNPSSVSQYLALELTGEYQKVLDHYNDMVSMLRSLFFNNLSNSASVKDLEQLYFLSDELSYLKVYLKLTFFNLQRMSNNLPKQLGSDIQSIHNKRIKQFQIKINDVDRMLQSIENLIDLGFNKISVSTNRSMSILAYISLVFLPLSFWASYYGMNFDSIAHTNEKVWVFWTISIPFTIVVMLLALYKSYAGYARKLILTIWSHTVMHFKVAKEHGVRKVSQKFRKYNH
ncbi:unnamed protein product [Ambrosiozyma monospora]|uniref:Unnamed protein product n=1 Tax=Ambrosiozyma monospora TaxID=43982 RepID=A0A9W6YR00_AMBMO|nr:unnamed protein product [Ambrosiozyma monospora]